MIDVKKKQEECKGDEDIKMERQQRKKEESSGNGRTVQKNE